MSGEGEVQFRDPERTVMTIGPGDVVYLPARLPSRIVPHTELVQVRIKDVPPFTEAVAWFCDACGALLHKVEFTTQVPQRHYWEAATDFNQHESLRTCDEDVPAFVELESGGPSPGACLVVGRG